MVVAVCGCPVRRRPCGVWCLVLDGRHAAEMLDVGDEAQYPDQYPMSRADYEDGGLSATMLAAQLEELEFYVVHLKPIK